jgi:hypothetical protein
MRVWLAEGRVSGDCLVWREGWRDWQEAGSVFPQFAPAARDAVPELRSMIEEEVYAPGPSPGARSSAGRQESEDARSNSSVVIVMMIALAAIVAVVVVLWLWLGSGGQNPARASAAGPAAAAAPERAPHSAGPFRGDSRGQPA